MLVDPRDTQKTSRDLLDLRDKATSALRAWINRVSLPADPAQELLDTLSGVFETVVTSIDKFDDDTLATEAARDTNSDTVLRRLETLLKGHVGRPLGEDAYLAAVKEGGLRG